VDIRQWFWKAFTPKALAWTGEMLKSAARIFHTWQPTALTLQLDQLLSIAEPGKAQAKRQASACYSHCSWAQVHICQILLKML